MDSPNKSRPLLGHTSDSDDGGDYEDQLVYDPSSTSTIRDARIGVDSHENVHDTSTTDDYEDSADLLKAPHSPPTDKFSFAYVVFYLLGMTTLLPWNFFMTAEDYWMYKFRNATTNSSTDITPTQATIISDLSFSASIPSTLFLILNACFGHKFPLKLRMNGSMLVILVVFILNTGLIKVNTDAWQDTFFDITIVSVVIMNISAAIMSGGLFGISGLFSSEYMTAVVSGQALGGILTAIAEIITLTFSTDALKSTWIFFLIGNVLLALSLVAYIAVSRTKFFKYHIEVKSTVSSYHLAEDEPNFRNVLSKMWLYGFTEWLVFAVTISVYPAVTVLVSSENHGNGSPWNDIYFIPVTNYLIFNTGDYLGRILAGMIEWPNNRPYTVATLSIMRIAFLPALIVCNTNPRHHLPVFIHSDYIFILLMCAFAFTNGYLANIAMIWAPKSVGIREKEMASSTMAAFLGLGLAFGSTLSLILVQLV